LSHKPNTLAAKVNADAGRALLKTAKGVMKSVGVPTPEIRVKLDVAIVNVARSTLDKLAPKHR